MENPESLDLYFDEKRKKILDKKRREIKERIKAEKRKKECGFSKRMKDIKEIIYCSFCGFKAKFVAVRKNDGKKIPCCKRCLPYNSNMPWVMIREPL
ncbi:MAG: hypothetical protein HYT36_00040 [Candidatus Staskawiczbacteria bacterium]|nr:hypothetical protein [Candidatus Staskawiczbacteria bacterium]